MSKKFVDERIPLISQFWLQLQIIIDWLFLPFIGPISLIYFRFVRGVTVKNVKEVRKKFRELASTGKPTMVCSNHLTSFDSVYLHYAFNSVSGYILNFRLLSWNVPAVENFKSNWFLSLFTYLGKTIPIDRSGTSDHHKFVLNKIRYLLDHNEICTIFPEGGRSRTGRVDVENVTYGVGNILNDMNDFQVLCVYMRGDKQDSYSLMPHKGDSIYCDIEAFEPRTELEGRKASRDLSIQIINRIKEMEDVYFQKKDAGMLDRQ